MKNREAIDWLREIKRQAPECLVRLTGNRLPRVLSTAGLFVRGWRKDVLYRQYFLAGMEDVVSIQAGNYRFVNKGSRV